MTIRSVAFLIGACLLAQHALADADSGERRILYWTDPMLPNFRADGPGKS